MFVKSNKKKYIKHILPEIRSEAVNHESNNFKAVLRNLQTEKMSIYGYSMAGKSIVANCAFSNKNLIIIMYEV